MTMNNDVESNAAPLVLPEIPPRPCWAQCVNLHLLPADVRQRLNLAYRQYYIIVRYEDNPTPLHTGAWVRLLDPKTKQLSEWVAAHFFYINTAIWPN